MEPQEGLLVAIKKHPLSQKPKFSASTATSIFYIVYHSEPATSDYLRSSTCLHFCTILIFRLFESVTKVK